MVKPRIAETYEGIQGEFDVMEYDRFARGMRDRGWMETGQIIKSGISGGKALEIGPGPGYLGLEWLKKTSNTCLEGLEISKNMIEIAERNAREYGFGLERVKYSAGNAMTMPFPDACFDAVFSGGSLHEWEAPLRVISEIYRVLKTGGRFCICDLRRDLPFFTRWFFYLSTKPQTMRSGLMTSLRASYTRSELEKIIADSPFKKTSVTKDFFGISVVGIKS